LQCDGSDRETDSADTTVFLPDVPALGGVHYYIVRAQNACAVGSAGEGSDLVERPAVSCP